NIRRRHAHRAAAELARQFRQRFADGLGSAGAGQHHVKWGAAAAAVGFVAVVDQILVVGVGVDGFHVAVIDTELVVHGLEHRRDGVGGAGSSRQNAVIVGDHGLIYAVYDVFYATFAGRRQQYAVDAVGLQVTAEA